MEKGHKKYQIFSGVSFNLGIFRVIAMKSGCNWAGLKHLETSPALLSKSSQGTSICTPRDRPEMCTPETFAIWTTGQCSPRSTHSLQRINDDQHLWWKIAHIQYGFWVVLIMVTPPFLKDKDQLHIQKTMEKTIDRAICGWAAVRQKSSSKISGSTGTPWTRRAIGNRSFRTGKTWNKPRETLAKTGQSV